MRFFTLFIFLTSYAWANLIPSTTHDYCANSRKEFWENLVSKQIDSQVKGLGLEAKNAAVTLSYLEISKLNSQSPEAAFMGHVYANASHHLGRLVRYSAWPYQSEIGKRDKALIQGPWLLRALRTAPHELSSRLMIHSLALYKTLSWSLLAASVCGNHYVVSLTDDIDLQLAFSSSDTKEFMYHFVRFEQTHLQKTMYSDFLIGSSAKTGMLDQMRFISFNGEQQTSFHQWCQDNNCKTTSFDLENRIAFDQWSISQEISHFETFTQRNLQAEIEEVAHTFFSPRSL